MTDDKKAEVIEIMLDMEKNMTKAIEALEWIVNLEETVKNVYPEVDALERDDRTKFFKELLGEEDLNRIEGVGEHLNSLLAGL